LFESLDVVLHANRKERGINKIGVAFCAISGIGSTAFLTIGMTFIATGFGRKSVGRAISFAHGIIENRSLKAGKALVLQLTTTSFAT